MISCDDILARFLERKKAHGVIAGRMRDIRDAYNGDIVVPLPEMDRSERNFTANLTAMGIDQIGARIGSTMPDVRFPQRRSQKSAKTELDLARDRRQAVLGWWDAGLMGLKLRRRARYLVGYGVSPLLVRPDFKRGYPRWDVRDPLATYPAPTSDPDSPEVDDCIFAVRRTYGWLKRRYPDEMASLRLGYGCGPDTEFEVLEYVDADELVTCVVGRANDGAPGDPAPGPSSEVMKLERLKNRAGVCTAVVPGRINLDRRQGQFDGLVGMHQMQAKLFALEVIAVQQDVFPDEWLVARQNETPEIIQVADGRIGQIGIVKGGDLRQQHSPAGHQTDSTIDRLERGQRLTGGIPPDFGGESQSNVRTGRRGENILSSTIDFGIQEAQQVLAASLEAENVRAIAVDRGYHNVAKSFYVGFGSDQADYTPSELFVTDRHIVSYAHAGTDANGLVVSGGQRVGMGTLSKRGFMEMDPLIDDPEAEADRVVAEGLEQAMLQGLQMQAAQGAIPPADLARIMDLVATDKQPLAKAVEQAQREAQERQAAQVAAQAPEAQPGLAAPGMGAEAGVAITEPEPSISNLSSLLSGLRRPQALSSPGEAARPEAMVG